MMFRHVPLALFVFISLAIVQAEDWPQWRGPNRDGKIQTNLTFDSQTQFKQRWSANVGTGFSSIVIADNHLITMGNSDDQDHVVCLDAETGEEKWKQSYAEPLDPNLFEGGPTSTPAIADGKVFTISRKGKINCYTLADGAQLWGLDVVKEFKVNVPTWGFTGSPLVIEDRVYFNVGTHGLCLNATDGQVIWASPNDVDAGYSSPLSIEALGQKLLVMLNAKAVNAVSPDNGKLIWSVRWITRYGINAADPLLVGEAKLLVSSGYGKGTGLIEFSDTAAELAWRNRDLKTQMSPGVLVNGAVCAIDGDEEGEPRLVCVNPQTGDLYWAEENFGSGSIFVVNDQLLALKETGECLVFLADQSSFKTVTSSKLNEGRCWAPPAMSGSHLYTRNADGTLTCTEVQ